MTADVIEKYAIVPGVHARRFDNELVILDLSGGKYHGLDAVGADIWERLTQGRTVGQIVAELQSIYDVTGEKLEADARQLIEKLVAAGLIKPSRTSAPEGVAGATE